jgi:sorting nexin-1/2
MLQLIELWETFLMQLDAEEDADVFYKPPVIPLTGSSNDDPGRLSGETQVEAAAIATAEQED